MAANESHQGSWVVDPQRSTVAWSVGHLGISATHGTFETFEGRLAEGAASGAVAAASVKTNEADRDRFVRSDEFLDADSFPLMSFSASAVDGGLDGELTIRDTTLPLRLDVERSERDGDALVLELRGTVRRRAYGLRFHQARGAADRGVADEVEIELHLVLVHDG